MNVSGDNTCASQAGTGSPGMTPHDTGYRLSTNPPSTVPSEWVVCIDASALPPDGSVCAEPERQVRAPSGVQQFHVTTTTLVPAPCSRGTSGSNAPQPLVASSSLLSTNSQPRPSTSLPQNSRQAPVRMPSSAALAAGSSAANSSHSQGSQGTSKATSDRGDLAPTPRKLSMRSAMLAVFHGGIVPPSSNALAAPSNPGSPAALSKANANGTVVAAAESKRSAASASRQQLQRSSSTAEKAAALAAAAAEKPTGHSSASRLSDIQGLIMRSASKGAIDAGAVMLDINRNNTAELSVAGAGCCPGTSGTSFTTSLDGTPGTSSRRQPWQLRWWRALWEGIKNESKKTVEAVRCKPTILVLPMIVLGLLLGLGLWAVLASANAEEQHRHDAAEKIAADKAMYIQTELDKTFMPAYVVSVSVQQDYQSYYPPQPDDLRIRYPNPWYLMHQPFDKLAGELIRLAKAGSVRTVSLIPNGYIRTMYPLRGNSPADDVNWKAIGKNWLNDTGNKQFVALSLRSRNLTIIGPYNLTQGGIGIVGMQAIHVNGTPTDTFNVLPGPDNISQPASSIPGMLNLTYTPEQTDAPKFWGFTTVLVSWDILRDNVTRLKDLQEQGYSYVLTRPHDNGTQLAVAWSDDTHPNKTDPTRRLVYYNLHHALSDPVVQPVMLANVNWTLYLSYTAGWVPSWKEPLIAMVVVLSVVLSTMVFIVVLSRYQQRRLLREVLHTASHLAHTTRTLEEEKNRMQALVARHFDLIEMLEGANTGDNGDAGTRSKIDAMRQRLLLGGSSGVRREAVGVAEQIQLQEMLGEGTFGKVYKGLWRGTEVAIKTIVLPANMSGKAKREKMAVMEAAISSSLCHPNIVQTYTYHIRPLRDSLGCSIPAAAGGPGFAAAGSGGGPDIAASANIEVLTNNGGIILGGSRDGSACCDSISTPATPATGNAHLDAAEAAFAAAQAAAGQQASTGAGTGTMDGHPENSGIHSYEVQLVLEFCDRGCLRDALNGGAFFGSAGLNFAAILDTAGDIAKALLHLHINDVLHGDLKATNVMLKSTASDSGRGVIAKVADFGLSVRLDHSATHISRAFQGTMTHMAPEVMLQGHISKAADVYAFGITMWEIFTSGHAYKGTPGALLGHQTSKEGRRPLFPIGTPSRYQALAERCWDVDVAKRPAFSEILDELTQMRSELAGHTPPLAAWTAVPGNGADGDADDGAAASPRAAQGLPPRWGWSGGSGTSGSQGGGVLPKVGGNSASGSGGGVIHVGSRAMGAAGVLNGSGRGGLSVMPSGSMAAGSILETIVEADENSRPLPMAMAAAAAAAAAPFGAHAKDE